MEISFLIYRDLSIVNSLSPKSDHEKEKNFEFPLVYHNKKSIDNN